MSLPPKIPGNLDLEKAIHALECMRKLSQLNVPTEATKLYAFLCDEERVLEVLKKIKLSAFE